jgi:cell fate regulator YaaT (PSP1 superfamily)
MAQTSSPQDPTSAAEPLVVGVRFHPMGKIYHFDASDHRDIEQGDYVLVETARGQQLGQVVEKRPLQEGTARENLKPVKRQATGRDMALHQDLREKESQVLAATREAASQLNLPVKIVTAEYTFDGERLTILYVSDDKDPNFGDLIQRIRRVADGHIDMRRVGVRDHAKLMGGYGACGELRCCSCFLPDFSPVSIKMAKNQGVSLNPSEITGMCGRLRCCLVYEEEQYKQACKMMPRRKKRVQTPHGEGKVVDLLPLKGMVVVQVDDRRIEVPVEEIVELAKA